MGKWQRLNNILAKFEEIAGCNCTFDNFLVIKHNICKKKGLHRLMQVNVNLIKDERFIANFGPAPITVLRCFFVVNRKCQHISSIFD